MPNIALWLADLGLEKYLGVFADAEIDSETLPDLREEDLKELDLPVGPRRKIWTSLCRMRSAETADPVTPVSRADVALPSHAERRHLTVMFVDLVGSTQMAMRLDAEDMREVISQYQNTVSSIVSSYKGFVATLMGDGVLCYFGWPHANEDDTERAVRAGLAAIDATTKITTPDGAALSARVGVATGVVVVGDLIGMGTRQEAVVVGETPNLAARLQSVAKPNQLVIPGEARSLLSNAFEVVSMGLCDLKGVDAPVEAFVVQREKAVESRFDARRSGTLIPLFGRDREMAKIAALWSDAQAGRGRAVLVDGEAGIGKSRVVRAAIDAVAADSHIRLTYQCSPYRSDSAFYPFIQQMSYAAGFTPKDSIDLRLNKLEAIVQGTLKTHALMAILLGIDGTQRYGAQTTSPTQQRVQLMQTIVDFLVAKAAEKPLLVVIEDLHWIDPTSLEMLDRLMDTLEDKRILLLITTRVPLEHDFGARPFVSRLSLDRLGRSRIYAMVDQLAGGKTLPKAIMKIIAEQTDGVPLFVEELTRTILESGALKDAGDGFELDGPISDIAIPATLHDSLMARLDRLGPFKEIAQISACLGREFDHRVLLQISDLPEEKLVGGLEALVASGMIQRRGTPPQARYLFKHALVRDAAYDSLLKERRRPVHRRILSVFESEPGAAPELLALHAEAAGITERAITLWEAAGTAAVARPAYKEAEAHLRRAIALNAPQVTAGDPEALQKALALYVKLSFALSPAKGLWSNEVEAALEQALALADKIGETPLRGDIIYGLLLGTYFRGSLEISVARADELKGLAQAADDIAQLLVAKRLASIGRVHLGRFLEAQAHLDDAEALCEQVADQDLAARFGHDPIVALKIYQSLNATFRGQTARAAAYLEAALTRAEQIGHINTTCTTLGLAVIAAQVAGDVAAETRHHKVLSALTREHNVAASRMWAEATNGLLQLARGDLGGYDTYLAGEKTILNANIRLLIPGHRVLAARRLHALDLHEKARDMADAAEALMQDTGERSWLPEVFRLRAEFAVSDGDTATAEDHLRAAIDLSQRNGARLWQLRAATDLAVIYTQLGRWSEARSILDAATKEIHPGDCPVETAKAAQILDKLGYAAAK